VPSETRRIVVTGAGGFVGLNLVEQLLGEGHDVVAVDVNPLPAAASQEFSLLPGRLEHVVADTTDLEQIGAAFHGAGTVVHAAAVTADRERELTDSRHIVDVNIGGTQTVLDAVAASSVDRLVFVSSGAVYGERTFGAAPIDETTPPEPASLYAITKLAGEHLARRRGANHHRSVLIARLAAVFGPWERDSGVRDFLSPMYQVAQAAQAGHRVAPGSLSPRNWLYSRDAATALAGLALATAPRHDLYNITPTEWFEPTDWAQFLGVLIGDGDPAFAIELTSDGPPDRVRAPVDNSRIRDEISGWPAYGPAAAFADYRKWLESHPRIA